MNSVLQELFELCEPGSLPSPWNFLKPASNLRQLPEPATLQATLTQRFSRDQLTRGGILIPGENGEKRLSPVVAGGTRQALFLRTEEGEIIDVVNMYGALVSNDPPALSSCHDHLSSSSGGDSKYILVAFGEDDLTVLRALRLPCTTAAGLERLSGQQARRLLADPGNPQGDGHAHEQLALVTAAGFRLVLVGWQPAKLAVQYLDALPAVISRLLNAETLLELDSSATVSVWFPTRDEHKRICAAFEFGEAPLVCQQMRESIETSTHSVTEFYMRTLPKNPVGYAVARSELLALLKPDRLTIASQDSVRARLNEFESEFQRCVLDTANQDAMMTTDPLEQSLKLMAADLMDQWHQRDRLKKWAKEHSEGRYRPLDQSFKVLGILRTRIKKVNPQSAKAGWFL